MKVRMIAPHKGDCRAVNLTRSHEWDTPWYYIGAEMMKRDRIGRPSKRSSHRFLVFGCNCATREGCPARLIVAVDAVEVAVDELLSEWWRPA